MVSVWAGTTGLFDEVPVADILRFEQEFLEYLRLNSPVLENIATTKEFSDEDQEATRQALQEFRNQFRTSEGLMLGREEFEAMDEKDIDQEKIVRKKQG